MSIESILRKHGHNTPRLVLSTGRVVVGPAAVGVSGLAITSHTFHGGEAPLAMAVSTEPWWKEAGALDADRAAMRRYFPGFVELDDVEGQAPRWGGEIDTGRGKFWIVVQHRTDHSLPRVTPVHPTRRIRTRGRRAEKAPHLFTNGDLCVAAPDDWNAAIDTVATVVAWAAHWHAMYVHWYSGGPWAAESFEAKRAA